MLTAAIGLAAIVVNTAAASAQDAAQGAAVYTAQKCSLCHSVAGKGNAKGPLDEVGAKLTPDQIRQWIVDPVAATAKAKATRKPPMAAKYAALPKGDIDALVAYLASLKK